jgi:nitric oxide synthase oxygenase domain/subunit
MKTSFDVAAILVIVAATIGQHIISVDGTRDPFNALTRVIEQNESVFADGLSQSLTDVCCHSLGWRTMFGTFDVQERQSVEGSSIELLSDYFEVTPSEARKVSGRIDNRCCGSDYLDGLTVTAFRALTGKQKPTE